MIFNRHFLLVVVLAVSSSLFAQYVNYTNFESISGSNTQIGWDIQSDQSGNIISCGDGKGWTDYDPSSITLSYYSTAYLQKLRANGSYNWVRYFTGTGTTTATATAKALSIDANGNIIVVGFFDATLNCLTPGAPGLTLFSVSSSGFKDIFIAKFDSIGNNIWVRTIGGTADDIANDVAVDVSGNVYICGNYRNTLDFDPGVGVYNLTTVSFSPRGFVLKLNSAGNFVWVSSVGSDVSKTEFKAVDVDNAGNVYLGGNFEGSNCDVNPGSDSLLINSTGETDGLILKLDNTGNYVWYHQFGGGASYLQSVNSVSLNGLGKLGVGGSYEGTMTYWPGGGTLLTGTTAESIYGCMFDTSGVFRWINKIPTSFRGYTNKVFCDKEASLYMAGTFWGTVDFDPSPTNTVNRSSFGLYDAFACKWDNLGAYRWSRSFGGTDWDECNALYVNSLNQVYLTGYFQNTPSFSPGSGAPSTFSSLGVEDAFIAVLCSSSDGVFNATSCSPTYVSPSGRYTWTSPGTYRDTIPNGGGCDSFMTINLSFASPSTATDVHEACDSYTWLNGTTYTGSNSTATYIIPNHAGCDSLIQLNLIIHSSNSVVDNINSCTPITWIDGNTYTTNNNTATVTLQNIYDCDSVIRLNLNITHIDATVSTTASGFIANQTAATYQWLDCGDSYAPVSGATGQSFSPPGDGSYAVQIMFNGCVDTSECINYVGLGALEYAENIYVYPNPVRDFIYIQSSYPIVAMEAMTSNGLRFQLKSSANRVDLSNLPSAVYWLKITTQESVGVIKIYKK